MASRLPDPPLLLITDRTQAVGGDLVAVVGAALEAGCRWLSLREKDLPPAAQMALLDLLRPLVRAVGGCLTIHGDARLAQHCDGVHLGVGGDVAAARARLGPGALIGLSCHSTAELAVAAAEGADYASLSPIYPSASKPGYGPALGSASLAAAPLPVLALGGVGVEQVAACYAAGAAGVAVMGGPMRRPAEMATLIAAWNAAATPGRKAGI